MFSEGAARFPNTRWSVVTGAAGGNSREALSALCETYWRPIYAYIRGSGRNSDDARDLTQSFFEHLIESDAVATATPERGRFRSFLIASVRHFLSNQHDRATALKRGGGASVFSLDLSGAEERLHLQDPDRDTPETLYERHWALALLERVLSRLELEYAGADRNRRFELLKPFLLAGRETADYEAVCAQLNLSEAGVRVAVHRLRLRFGELLRDEIAHTVASEADVDSEIRYLIAALGRGSSL